MIQTSLLADYLIFTSSWRLSGTAKLSQLMCDIRSLPSSVILKRWQRVSFLQVSRLINFFFSSDAITFEALEREMPSSSANSPDSKLSCSRRILSSIASFMLSWKFFSNLISKAPIALYMFLILLIHRLFINACFFNPCLTRLSGIGKALLLQ